MSLLNLTEVDWAQFYEFLLNANKSFGHVAGDLTGSVVKAVQDIKSSVAGATYDVFFGPTPTGINGLDKVTNAINPVRHEFVKATVGTSNLIELAGGAGLVLSRFLGRRRDVSPTLTRTAEKLAQTAETQQRQIKQLTSQWLQPASNTVSKVALPVGRLSL